MKIKQIEEKDRLDIQTKLNMCAGKIFTNNYVPEHVHEDLPGYKRDGLMIYIDQLNYKEFLSNPDTAIKNTKLINFEMMHAQCRGMPRMHSHQFYQTVREKNVAKIPQKDRKKTVAACLRSERKEVFVEKKLAFSRF